MDLFLCKMTVSFYYFASEYHVSMHAHGTTGYFRNGPGIHKSPLATTVYGIAQVCTKIVVTFGC